MLAAGLAELVSLAFLGVNALFPYGLALGTAVALICMHLLAVSIEQAMRARRRGAVITGYILRIVLYGGALFLAFRTSDVAGLGCVVGLLLPRLMLPVQLFAVPKVLSLAGKRPQESFRYEAYTKSRMFEKEPRIVLYKRGRAYMTHRHFVKYRRVPQGPEAFSRGKNAWK
ncbi:MAG: hypothetical protein LBR44_01530 [Clostridiales Family XIII bacterium]|nr:hypothetical protein [Clostridiales Family XIII bacterium]